MDIFEAVLASARPLLCQVALHAARELGLPDRPPADAVPHKLEALQEVLRVEGLDPCLPSPPPPLGDWSRLAEVIQGAPPVDASAHVEAYARHLDGLARIHAPGLAVIAGPVRHVLDLGGGLGAYGLAMVERSPGARLTLVEAPAVAALARESLASRSNVEVVEADLLDTALPSADLVLLVNVLHLLSPGACRDLIARSAAALEPGGRLLIKDLDGDGSPLACWFSLNMALYTEGGSVYAPTEVREWCEAAGLGVSSHSLNSSPASMVLLAS